jgi:2-methylcitrate dehydratase PrpD
MAKFTFDLAEFVANTVYEKLPEPVVREAKKRILDVAGIGLSGYLSESGQRITDYINSQNRPGACTLWGSGEKADAEWAALANATMTFHLELDDVHRTSHTHPGVSTIPAALAICEEHRLSGKALIAAVVCGYEVGIRAGLAVSPSIYVDRPLLAPGTLSTFSAAAAAARLFGFDAQQITGVLGSAAYITPVSPFETFKRGFSIKDIIMGWGAYAGILAAKMRRFGFEGADTGIEGDFGYAKAVSSTYDFDKGLHGLGKNYTILDTGIKPYACCRQHHAAIDATLAIKEKHNIAPDRIRKIVDRTFRVSSRGNNPTPRTIAEAKYSNPYIIAMALMEGAAWREQFTQDKINDPRVLELAAKVDVVADDDLDKLYDEKWPSIVEITTTDGTVYSERVDLPKGEPEFPVTDEELKDKFMSLSTDLVSSEQAETIWETGMRIDELKDVGEFTALLVKG